MPKYTRHKTNYPGVHFIIGTSVANGKPEKIFYITYRLRGKVIEEKVGRQFQDKMTAAQASFIRARKINGELLPNKERYKLKHEKVWILNLIWEEYKNSKSHLSRITDQGYQFNKHIRPILGDKKPEDLSPLDIDKFRKHLTENNSIHIVRDVLAQLKRLLNFGASRQLSPPVSFKIELPKYDDRKTEDLTSQQLSDLMIVIEDENNSDPASIMKLALFTGMRKSEILKLEWRDISFDRGFISLRDPKGVVQQKIPMNSMACEVFTILQENRQSDYLFPSPSGGLRHRNSFAIQLRRIRDKAGLPKDFRPLHGLRHVYASMLASSGKVDMYTLQKLLTHKSPQMTQRYAHLRDDALKRASDLVGDLISQTVNKSNNNQG